MEDIEIVKWNQIRGNPYSVKLRPEMLSDNGTAIRMMCVLKGDRIPEEQKQLNAPGTGARRYPSQNRAVIFDREYVQARLKTQILEPLKLNSLEELNSVLMDNQNSTQEC
jgi:hypothetical protein